MPEECFSFNELMQCNFDSAVNDTVNTDQMPYIKLAVDLPDQFRGRTKGEYVRKKSTKKNNQQAELRSIRYLSDRESHRHLTLLVCFYQICSADRHILLLIDSRKTPEDTLISNAF